MIKIKITSEYLNALILKIENNINWNIFVLINKKLIKEK